MSFPISLSRKLLCVLFLCVSLPALRAEHPAKIEPVITSNGTLVLQVAKMGGDSRLAGIQEYAIMVSEDLLEWREMARSTLLEELQVEDLQGQPRPARFYRIVGVDLEETIRVFSEGVRVRLSNVSEFTSGIVLDGVTLAEYEEVRGQVAALREEIVAILASGAVVPESLLLNYRKSAGEIDHLLVSQPLVLEWKGSRYEIETSRAMKALNQQYARLDAVTLQDYDRLLGVDSEDLQGLESFQEFVDRRQVGLSSSLPVFDAISPSGQFDLTTRLVRKHLDILSEEVADSDWDGIWEIDYGLYARLLNGMERLERENVALADRIETASPVVLSDLLVDPLPTAGLALALRAIDFQQSAVKDMILENVGSKELDEAFLSQASSEALDLLGRRQVRAFDLLKDVVLRSGRGFELFPPLRLELSENGVTFSELERARLALSAYRMAARESVFSLVEEMELSPETRRLSLDLFDRILNGFYRNGYRSDGVYGTPRAHWSQSWLRGDVVFEGFENEPISVSTGMRNFVYRLPRQIDELLKYSAIEEAINEDGLEALLDVSGYRDLLQVDLQEGREPPEGGLSHYAMNIQLIHALLRYDDTLVFDGKFDLARFGRLLGLGGSLDTQIDAIRSSVDLALEELGDLGLEKGEAISWQTYYEQREIVDRALDELHLLYAETDSGFGSIERNFILELVGDGWREIHHQLEPFWGGSSVEVPEGSVLIEIEGVMHEIDIGWLARIFEGTLSRVAVSLYDDRYTRFQIARLAGISEDDLLGVSSEWAYGENIYYSDRWRDRPTEELLEGRPNLAELYWGFLPRLLESLGAKILTIEGSVDRTKIEAALTRGLGLSVPVGSSIESMVRQIADKELNSFIVKYDQADFSLWETWEIVEADFLALKVRVAAAAVPHVAGLVQEERERLPRRNLIGRQLSFGNFWLHNFLSNNRRPDTVNVDLGEQTLTFDFSATESWFSPWYRRKERIQDAFSGLIGDDFVRSKEIKRNLYYTSDGLLGEDALYYSSIDTRKLLVSVLRRIVQGGDGVPDVYRDSIAVDGHVNGEALRRFCLGIDGLFNLVLADARLVVSKSLLRMEPYRSRPMTIENLEAYYDELLEARQELIGLVEDELSNIPASDSVEIEEAVTREYQDVLRPFLEYMHSNRLSIEQENDLLEVPFEEIKDALVEALQSRYPGETLAAYHYASFFGVSVGELREFDKLESFLNSQIIALSRNSEYVEVVSKLSEIGYYQLVDLLFKRFGTSYRDEGTGEYDLDRLIEMASLEETGIVRAEASVNELFDAALSEIESIEVPNTLDGLEAIVASLSSQREAIRSTLMDEITALSVEGIERVEKLVDERNLEYVSFVEGIVLEVPIQLEAIDASRFVIDMSGLESDLIAVLKEKLEAYEKRELEERGTVPVGNSYDWETAKIEIYLLIARLAYAYGAFATDEGTFSVTRFAEQLEVKDSGRMEAFADAAFAEEKKELELVFPVNPGLVSLTEVAAMGEQLIRSRQTFYRLYQRSRFSGPRYDYRNPVLERWHEFVDLYSIQLWGGDLLLENGTSEVRLPFQRMRELSRNAYSSGATGFLDTYAVGGETDREYRRFTDLDYSPVSDELVHTSAFGAVSSGISALETHFQNMAISFPSNPEEEERLPSGFARFLVLPGVESMDLEGLELGVLREFDIPQREAKELMKGAFNLRVLSPGSPLYLTVTGRNGAFVDRNEIFPPDLEGVGYEHLSWRDQKFRVFVEIALDYWDILVDEDGLFQEDVFDELIRTDLNQDTDESN